MSLLNRFEIKKKGHHPNNELNMMRNEPLLCLSNCSMDLQAISESLPLYFSPVLLKFSWYHKNVSDIPTSWCLAECNDEIQMTKFELLYSANVAQHMFTPPLSCNIRTSRRSCHGNQGFVFHNSWDKKEWLREKGVRRNGRRDLMPRYWHQPRKGRTADRIQWRDACRTRAKEDVKISTRSS